ncbi:hypothetical protein N1851_027190 [Merluccius polli]|uniref:Uncharacterized protein n=1 Tax=Merluccius polli TaxID=89951 RepID=A0AA47NTD0_MERPO|nr:hypothetical protein N1851_027190 [Merluccius polli]
MTRSGFLWGPGHNYFFTSPDNENGAVAFTAKLRPTATRPTLKFAKVSINEGHAYNNETSIYLPSGWHLSLYGTHFRRPPWIGPQPLEGVSSSSAVGFGNLWAPEYEVSLSH